jgi:hypothetical protein
MLSPIVISLIGGISAKYIKTRRKGGRENISLLGKYRRYLK